MPARLHGKRLSEHEHSMWVKVRAAARKSGARSPEAVATAAVLKHRRKRK